jgi:acyl carrier protein
MLDSHMAVLVPGAAPCSDAVVLAEVKDIVRQVLEDGTIELHASMPIDELKAWDSMNHVAILVEAECRFDVLFELDELDTVLTIGHLVRLIQAKRSLRDRAVC